MEYYFLYFAFAILVSLLLLLIWMQITHCYDHFPSPKYRIPFVGHVFRIREPKCLIEFVNKVFSEVNKKTATVWMLIQPNIFSKDLKFFENVLKSNELIKKSMGYFLLEEWLGEGLLMSTGEKWKNRRRLLTPAFHFNILSANIEIMNRHAKNLIHYMNNKESGSLFEISDVVKYFSLDLLCETAMGIKCNTLNSNDNSLESEYIRAVDFLSHGITDRYLKPCYRSSFIYRYFSAKGARYFKYLDFTKAYTRKVIENRIQLLENVPEIKSSIFLDILIAAYKKKEIDIEGILEEVNTFMFEGHDTVSSAITWTLYLLGKHHSVQEKVYQEIKELASDSVDQIILGKLDYLECVIKESMRVHPPVGAVARESTVDHFVNTPLMIPRKSQIFLFIYHMHRDESVWKDATSFIPERFQDDDYKNRNPFSYVPFSAGPRNCIGQRFAMMELKIALFHLLRNFSFVSTQEENELEQHIDVIHRAGTGIFLNVYHR